MKSVFEDNTLNFPYYLTEERKQGILRALTDFSNGKNYFFNKQNEDLLQGDILTKLTVFDQTDGSQKSITAAVISNSCDLSQADGRVLKPLATFCPVLSLKKISDILEAKKVSSEKIQGSLNEIRQQKSNAFYYLPYLSSNDDESAVWYGNTFSLPLEKIVSKNPKPVRSLSDFGFYLFVFKLSVHFCRLHENFDRSK